MTLNDLVKSTHDFKPSFFFTADRVNIDQTKITRNRGVRTILYSGISRDYAANTDKEPYKTRTVQIQFSMPRGVDVEDYVPSAENDVVTVRSSSPGYKFHFQYSNKARGAQFGSVSPFTVSGKGRPVNPKNYPGCDKHILAYAKALSENGLIRDLSRYPASPRI